MPRIRAVLFDLDDTLVHDQQGYRAAAAAAWAAVAGSAVDEDELFAELRRASRKRWEESPAREYCRAVGLFPLAGLVTSFPGEGEELAAMQEWAPGYRRSVWRRVLTHLGGSRALAGDLSQAFSEHTLAGARPLEGARALVQALDGRYRLGVVTNGAVDLQGAKLEASGLSGHFQAVAISTELGYAKPDARIFRHVTDALGIAAHEALVVGDNRVNDIEGGVAAGLQAVWLQPDRERWPETPPGSTAVAALSDVADVIAALDSGQTG